MTARDALALVEKAIGHASDLPDDLRWTNVEVMEVLVLIGRAFEIPADVEIRSHEIDHLKQ